MAAAELHGIGPVSYTHLDVYKRQPEGCLPFLLGRPLSETLVMFGLALTRNNNRMGLVRRGEGRYGGPVFPDGKDLYR